MKTHYDTLGVSKNATKKEIKAAFRKLSLETHPDVAAGSANVERFKQISEAHCILSNEAERQLYDAEMMDPIKSELRRNRGYGRSSAAAGGRHHGPLNHHAHSVFDAMARPRTIALGLTIGVTTMMAFSYVFSNDKARIDDKPALVEAWFNPETRQYEPPAPWDPTYKRLKPNLEYVPRDNVRHGRQ